MFSLVLPTFNESQNLPELLPKIRDVLVGTDYEVIVVDDDSPDETWRVAQELGKEYPELHVIRRIGRRGLASAVIEGFLAAKGEVLAVMDADGQHDLKLLPELNQIVEQNHGMAIGSRYIEGGSVGEWDEQRYLLSRIATKLALSLCKVKVKDPMSGFFAIDAKLFESVQGKLNPKGFKILLDFLVHIPRDTNVKEIPFTFSSRLHGESKLSWKVQWEFLEYLYDVTLGRFIPMMFVKYCIVGFLGVFVHVGSYSLYANLMRGDSLSFLGFSLAVISATETAIIFNFLLNNIWTFARHKLTGKGMLIGFLKFNAACALGALANYAVAALLFSQGFAELAAVIIGAFVAVLWNYTMNKVFTWRA